jgi:hypothetical protein
MACKSDDSLLIYFYTVQKVSFSIALICDKMPMDNHQTFEQPPKGMAVITAPCRLRTAIPHVNRKNVITISSMRIVSLPKRHKNTGLEEG